MTNYEADNMYQKTLTFLGSRLDKKRKKRRVGEGEGWEITKKRNEERITGGLKDGDLVEIQRETVYRNCHHTPRVVLCGLESCLKIRNEFYTRPCKCLVLPGGHFFFFLLT